MTTLIVKLVLALSVLILALVVLGGLWVYYWWQDRRARKRNRR